MSSILKKIIQFIIFLGLGVGLMYWIYINQVKTYNVYCTIHNIPDSECNLLDKLWHDLLSINLIYTFLIFVAFFLSNYFRSLRWRMMLSSIGYNVHAINSMGSILVGYLANLGLPRSGEFIRPALLTRYEKVPLTITVGTVALDRIIDLISMAFIILIAIFTQYKTFVQLYYDHLSQIPLFQQLILPAMGLLFLIILVVTRNIWKHWHLIQTFRNKTRGFLDGLLSIRNIENKSLFLLYTAMIWLWFFVMMYCALKSFGPTSQVPISTALIIYVFGSMGMLVPTPGGMGSYHYLVILALSYFSINEIDAFSFANISFFSANFANNIVLGLSGLMIMHFYNKKKRKLQTTELNSSTELIINS
ncbi:MAG: lysylphosphatidylglycerol synthase transmembrane domain-containing protein [Saprospiraceae bacterium]